MHATYSLVNYIFWTIWFDDECAELLSENESLWVIPTLENFEEIS